MRPEDRRCGQAHPYLYPYPYPHGLCVVENGVLVDRVCVLKVCDDYLRSSEGQFAVTKTRLLFEPAQ